MMPSCGRSILFMKCPMEYRTYRKVLQMVTELHVRGYQRLRIVPAMAPSGLYWRCAITPVTNISSRHGARTLSWDTLVAHYSSGQERKYFGWDDCSRVTASRLADLFIARFPAIVDAGRGSDWVYAGWYLEMLSLTYPNCLPIAHTDSEAFDDCLMTVGEKFDVRIPLPPAGWGPAERPRSRSRLVAVAGETPGDNRPGAMKPRFAPPH
jgi:hypothetical protein